MKGSLHPLAQAQFDAGRVPADTRLNGISIVFSRSAAQQADLEALLAAQQDPTSPLFHKWLNPDQFAARFGMAQEDLDKVQSWLEQQGFSIDSVARSKNLIRFSGTVGQVEQAFQTEMHYYKSDGEKHFAPSTGLSLPAAFAPTVAGVRNLDDFRPRAMHIRGNTLRPRSAYTFWGQTQQYVLFAPGDIVKVYDIGPLYTGGNNGTGQSIVIVGQSSITATDIENFQNAAGLTVKDPTQVLVPGTGNPLAVAGDQGESDLDLEWSSAIAPGAEVFFVYTGSSQNYGVFDSIEYAVDQQIGNIISVSYGACEAEISSSTSTTLESILAQAATQGQTILAASGDLGSTACAGQSAAGTNEYALEVSYPASSKYVTGVGGTEITQANDAVGTYWGPATSKSTPALTTALKYIPEVAWNDDSAPSGTSSGGLGASGGGASTIYTSKPAFQTGVPGIPADGKRDVPDIALYSSPNLPGYLYCTSDQSDWYTAGGQVASCNSGFLDSTSGYFTVAGGTSFATPIFAGMLAIINQEKDYSTGQGLFNTPLYSLASNAATYAAAFNDVQSGNNKCTAGATFCGTQTGGFSAGVGYDQVTGLGSVDLAKLAAATGWPAPSALIDTTTSVSASNATPASGAQVTFTITVKAGSTPVTSGTVDLQIDGGTAWGATGGTTVTGQALSNTGTVSYTTSFTTGSVHQVLAQYKGDATHAASTGVAQVTLPSSIAFTLTGTDLTVSRGSSGNSTITVKPVGGYTGTVVLNISGTSNNTALTNLCYSFTTMNSSGNGTVTVSGASPVTTSLTLDTNASDCVAAAVVKPGQPVMHSVNLRRLKTAKNTGINPAAPATIAFAGLLLAGFLGRYSRKFRNLAGLIALLAVGLAVSACGGGGGGGGTTPPTNPAKGAYTITVAGVDSVTPSIAANTTFNFTIN